MSRNVPQKSSSDIVATLATNLNASQCMELDP